MVCTITVIGVTKRPRRCIQHFGVCKMMTNVKKIGLGSSWLLLTLLMIGMSWSAAVSPATDVVMTPSGSEEATTPEDVLALPESDGNLLTGWDHDPATELVGSRTAESKTYVQEDGSFIASVSATPIHYLDEGVWKDIDLNIDSTESGWAVTENSFKTYFSEDVRGGAAISVRDDVEPIRVGIEPIVVMLENETLLPMPYDEAPNPEAVKMGANQIRYPMTMTTELDYVVTTTSVKQNLNLREMPFVPEGFEGWFGLQETVVLPPGYALFRGEVMIEDGETVTTNQTIDVRHLETGELLVTFDQPWIQESNFEVVGEPTLGMYVIRAYGEVIHITTVIDTAWLLDENRSYPISIDPSVNAGPSRTGYAYYYRYQSWWGAYYTYERAYATNSWGSLATCKGAGSSTHSCTSSSTYNWYYRWVWYRFDLSGKLPSGATVTDVDFESGSGRYRSGARSFDLAVIKSGTSQSSNMVDVNSYLGGGGWRTARYIRQSASSSASTSLSDPGYYWSGMSAIRTISMNSDGISDVQDAVDGNGAGTSGNILSLSLRVAGTRAPFWYWCGASTYSYCNTNTELPKMEIQYTGGSDTTPPSAEFTEYNGVTSYVTESRTMFIQLLDASGIDTTSADGPRLYYSVNNGTWASGAASTIGTCLAGTWCNFKATIPAVNADDYVEYYWAYQDTPTSGNPNMGTTPSGGVGSPGTITTHVSAPYDYHVQDVEKATAGDRKIQVLMNDQTNYRWNGPNWGFFDYQLTMWDMNDEYLIEMDLSNCGTGSSYCFETGSSTSYTNLWDLRYVATRSNGYIYTTAMDKAEIPGLTFTANNGPGFNVMYYYDSGCTATGSSVSGCFGVMGIGSATSGIESKVTGGTVYTAFDIGSNDDGMVRVDVPGDFTGSFGALPINASISTGSTVRDHICMGTNGYIMFTRGGNQYCTSWHLATYGFNGFSVGNMDTRVINSGWGGVAAKSSNIRPTPDTFPPMLEFSPLLDSYVEDGRTVSVDITDAGDPPMGLNTTSGNNAQGDLIRPHIKYRVNDVVNSTGWGSWSVRAMSQPSGSSLADCELATCTWTAEIPGTDRGNTVEYTIHAEDKNGNINASSPTNYSIGTPTKVFTVEWHDQNCGFGQQYKCSWQVRLYDVTNEIEFEYDTNSNAQYDWAKIGYQSPAGTDGDDIRGRGPGYVAGASPFSNNYRIATDGTTHGTETYSPGMTELYNFDEVFNGNSNGYPYTYYCTRYWSSYRSDCSTVIDLPAGFSFDYFGTNYSGDNGHKIHAIRHGAMQFSTSSSSNSAQMMYYGWGTNMPSLPSTASYVNNVDLAPFWGYYVSYYCYYNNNADCSIRTKLIPFDGAGTDVTSDLTKDTIWDLEQSPIRVIPPSGQDYINTGDYDLTIEPGVEVQIMSGKGIAVTGPCAKLTSNGNETHGVKFTNLGETRAKGVAFTNGGCTSATTDDRHVMTHTTFENMDIAISAGSKHGSAPHYNGNVGNFTLSDMTFRNVSKAISHGSGGGTGFTMTDFDISNVSQACLDLPEDSVVELREGQMTDCNTNNEWWGGGIVSWPGSTGGSLIMENVDMTDVRANGVSVDYENLEMYNITMMNPNIAGSQEVCTQASPPDCADGAVHHDPSGASGSNLVMSNVVFENFSNAVLTHATDSYSISDVTGTGLAGFLSVIPGGPSSAVAGPDGDNAEISNVAMEGGSNWKSEVYLERTSPKSIEDITVTGAGGADGLYLSGAAASPASINVDDLSVASLLVSGCGWSIKATDVTLAGGSDVPVKSTCSSSTSGNTITLSGATINRNGNGAYGAYASNSVITVADTTLDSGYSSGIAAAGVNGDVRMVGINYGGTDCVTSSGYAGLASCNVDPLHPSAAIYVGGLATVGVYRVMNLVPTYVADHKVTTQLADTSGSSAVPLLTVGTTSTDGAGQANAWLITNKVERVSGASTVTATYDDHMFNIAGGAGQNITTPDDPWYTDDTSDPAHTGYDFPLLVGGHADFKLEAFPEDWNGTTKDCAFLQSNTSMTGGYYLYTMRLITLSTDLVLDNCKLHLNGTRMAVNVTSANAPKITILNGGELLITGGMSSGGEVGNLRAVSTTDPWTMDIQNGGTLVMDHAYMKEMAPNTNTGTSFLIGDGASVEMRNGSYILGSTTVDPSMATVKVNGGTLTTNNARISNVGQTGTGLWLEQTSSSSVVDITVENANTGIKVHNAAPSVDGFTLSNNEVGVDVYGSMSLPSIYRSTALSGESRGWVTHEIDITSFAKDFDVIQMGFNSVYNGGNAHPTNNNWAYRDYMIYDRIRLAVDVGDGSGLQNVTYTHPSAMNTDSDTSQPEAAVWDCNAYGYQYNPGGSYQYAYYWYMTTYGPSQLGVNGSTNSPPTNFGFRVNSAEGIPNSQNYYPMHFWADYWPSMYQSAYPHTPEYAGGGSGGMWGYYGVCADYVYRYSAPSTTGYRVEYPMVNTANANIVSAKVYVDVFHNRHDYYQDRFDYVFRGGGSDNAYTSADLDAARAMQFGREFGVAQLDNGQITGATTGITSSGNRAAAGFGDIVITDAANEAILIDGSTNFVMSDVNATDGRYGIRTTSSSSGDLHATGASLWNQSIDGLVLGKDMRMSFGGEIQNAAGAAINVLSSSSGDWSFRNLQINNSGTALATAGSGSVVMQDVTMNNNVVDAEISAGAVVRFVEGVVDPAKVSVTGQGEFQRARNLDIHVEHNSVATVASPVKLLDSNGRSVDSGTTDAGGDLLGAEFVTWTKDASQPTHQIANLAGYQVVSVAKIEYTTSNKDFRYKVETLNLNDAPGNTASVDLTERIAHRACYSFTSSNYDMLQPCTGTHYLGSSSSRNSGGMMEYGYYGAMGSQASHNFENTSILIDAPNAYTDGYSNTSFNNSVVIVTGGYNGLANLYVRYPYDKSLFMDNGAVYALQPDKENGGFRIGYSGTYNYGGFNISDSTLVGMASFGTGKGYYGDAPEINFVDNTVTHHRVAAKSSTTYYEDVCSMTSGVDGAVIRGNTFYDCGVGFFVPNNYYATSSFYGGTGTNELTVSDNTFVDTMNLAVWFYLQSHGDEITVDGNTVTGLAPSYGVYVQDNTMNGLNISNNDIYAENPVFMRGAKNWNITDNTIRGMSNPSLSGIYVRQGHGLISGNDLIDSDGGINVFGIYKEAATTANPYPERHSLDVNDNTIRFSAGRTPTSAMGITVEECGATTTQTGTEDLWVNTSGNDVQVISNALVVNECNVADTGSSYTSLGGSASRVHVVSIMSSTFSPENLTVDAGDTVRWRLVQYNTNPSNYQHSTTADNGDWDSGLMNLGATFSHTFTTVGTYSYACSVHPTMTGNVTVVAGSGQGLASTGINVAGGDDTLMLDGTDVSGFTIAVSQSGGSLDVSGGSLLVADEVGIDAFDVDYTGDGASIEVDDEYGVALNIRSPTGLAGGRNVLDIANTDVSGSIGLLATAHKEFRWNGGTSNAGTTLQTLATASGTIENMTWTNTDTEIDAGAYSVITSIGNGELTPAKLTIDSTAIVHEGNLLNLTVTHRGGAASEVGLVIKSNEAVQIPAYGIDLSGSGRAEYVSAAWRTKAGAGGTGINADSDLSDWLGDYEKNIADDMMPGQVAFNNASVPKGDMKITWDDDNLYIAFSGVTFSATDGLMYLDTRPGGSVSGDTWYVSHSLPFMADFMLFAEDWTTWGIREVNPTGTWIDTTNSCTGLDSSVAYGYPGVTPTWDLDSEFIIPWDCLGEPTEEVRWLAVVQNETNGGILGAYPPANIPWLAATGGIDNPNSGQSFIDFGTFRLDNNEDLDDGTLEDFVLIYRTYAGSTTQTTPRIYEIIVKADDGDGYWDWGNHENLQMNQNRDVEIDILRAKPSIIGLNDQTVLEDSGTTELSLTNLVQDHQTDNADMAWTVIDDTENDHEHLTPYTHSMNGHTLSISTLQDQFGGHLLEVTVEDEHGLTNTTEIWYNVTNVNDKPVICDPARMTASVDNCLPVFWDVTPGDGVMRLNVRDEKAVDDGSPWVISRSLGDSSNVSGGEETVSSFIIDMENEQDQEDNNPHYFDGGQMFTWSAAFAANSTDCVAFSMNVMGNGIQLAENESNEKGGTCWFILDLSDGVDDADSFPLSFTVNPINDAPVIPDFDAATNTVVTVGNGTIETDFLWVVMEDDVTAENLTFDLSAMMKDIDHLNSELDWSIEEADTCTYENYFFITVDNANEKLILDLIPDAATDAPVSEIDYLQDADGDGETDNGIHQIQPESGVECLVYLRLSDTGDAPSHTDYNQSGYDTYDQRSERQDLRIRVRNTPEARPDYHFDAEFGFDFLNIKAVLPGTRVPFDVIVQNDGDEKDLYNYEHDLHVLFYTDDNPGVVQERVIIDAADMLDTGEELKVRGWVTLNGASKEVRAFAEVKTIHPYTGNYIDAEQRRPVLEELNWDDNNQTTMQTNTSLPQMVQLMSASSVASFIPSLMTIGLVGMFVGMNILAGRREEDEAEFEGDSSLVADDEAVSPVIATILLVAITVTLSGVIYVWADSLAETDTKAAPRLTVTAEADTDGSQPDWAWRLEVTQHQNMLATQNVKVTVEWEDASGTTQVYEVMLTDKYGPGEFGENSSTHGVYGRLPSNSDAMVTFKDDIDCSAGSSCTTGYGSSDIIYVRMHDQNGDKIDNAQITVFYLPPNQAATPLMSFIGTYNPSAIQPA